MHLPPLLQALSASMAPGLSGPLLLRLEFAKVKEMMAFHVKSVHGKRLLASLVPLDDREAIQGRLDLVRECRELAFSGKEPPVDGLVDLLEILLVVQADGAMLEPEQLLDVFQVLRLGRRFKDWEGRLSGTWPGLKALADLIEPQPYVEKVIEEAIDPRATVKDTASPALQKFRKEIANLRERLQKFLNGILNHSKYAPAFQERYITERSNRFVIPVLADHKGLLPGIVHHQSSSGATLFVEPFGAVEMGNALVKALDDEQREVRRILRSLTASVAAKREAASVLHEVLGIVDLFRGVARAAEQYRLEPPKLSHRREILLMQARHPVLLLSKREEEVVPIDVHLSERTPILIITGPNTGGKTVALKTVGLLALMAQAGLPIPAQDGSRLPVFSKLFADIGDEQTIEGSLSTFSAHMVKIKALLEGADGNSLVLIDELGTGTDPTEGAALGVAILKELHRRNCTVLVTTHHEALKAFGYSEPYAENASVDFDPVSLAPAYKLLIGVAGESNAFVIAERLEIPLEVINDARRILAANDTEARDVVHRLEVQQRGAAHARSEMEQHAAEALRAGNIAQEKLEQAKQKADQLVAEAHAKAAEILKETERTASFLLEKTKNHLRTLSERGAPPLIPKPEPLHEIQELKEEHVEAAKPLTRKTPFRPVAIGKIEPGDIMEILDVQQHGTVVKVDQKKHLVSLDVKGIIIKVSPDRLQAVSRGGKAAKPERSEVEWEPRPVEEVPNWLNVIGKTRDDALHEVAEYLDKALQTGHKQVSLIHGVGEGILKKAIQRFLNSHPEVRSNRPGEQWEGGAGVTVVTFSEEE